ncbi:MAG TPA: ABATE domain-containing protein [Chloroflexota bacterium]|jgi:predicted RNA-binding Zn ribbon-like protein
MPTYPWLDLPLPLELVNTRFASSGEPVDGLQTPEDLDAWLQTNAAHLEAPPPRATPALLERFRALRIALAQLLGAALDGTTPPLAAVRLVNLLSLAAPRVPLLEVHGTVYQRSMADLADTDTAALATVARACIELLAGADRARLRRCGGPGCVLLFLKDPRRRAWCSDACGNRARVARHYLRHHHASALSHPAELSHKA